MPKFWRRTKFREKNININFLVRISRGHSWPLRPDAWGSKSFSHHRSRWEMHTLVRTSTIFGADVHDPKGCQKTLCKKMCVDLLDPKSARCYKQREKFNTKFLAALQFISPIQAPWLSAANEGGASGQEKRQHIEYLHCQMGDWFLYTSSFLTVQRQRCIKFRVLRAQDFHTPLAQKV